MLSISEPVQVIPGDIGIAELPLGTTFGPYAPSDFEFAWTLTGQFDWIWGKVRIAMPPGRLLLARTDTLARYAWGRVPGTRQAYAEFRLADSADSLPILTDWPLTRPLVPGGILAQLCDYILWLSGHGGEAARAQIRRAETMLLHAFIGGLMPDQHREDPLPDPMSSAVAYVRRTWSSDGMRAISVDELAGAASMSRSHLCRVFRYQFGGSPVAALERVRCSRAAGLLARSNLSVTAIARSCGFVNPYYFSRRFSALYGVAPTTYRQRPECRRLLLDSAGLTDLEQRLRLPVD